MWMFSWFFSRQFAIGVQKCADILNIYFVYCWIYSSALQFFGGIPRFFKIYKKVILSLKFDFALSNLVVLFLSLPYWLWLVLPVLCSGEVVKVSGMVVHTCSLSVWEAKARGSPWVQGQLGLYREFKDNLNTELQVRPCLHKTKQRKAKKKWHK